jgi:hypothetical protein
MKMNHDEQRWQAKFEKLRASNDDDDDDEFKSL